MISGGIDIGGTKIEARLFSGDLQTIDMRRVPTPRDTLENFVDALAEQILWLEARSGSGARLPVGVAFPGLIDRQSGRAFTSNLPVSGHDIETVLAERIGRRLPFMNDCQAFALSEANGGAGDGFDSVVGLIMGTGVGAGLTVEGRLTRRLNGGALEVGHIGVPARTLTPRGLPLWPCGCGKQGCFEQYVSGSGLAALGSFRLGRPVTSEEVVSLASGDDTQGVAILCEWAEIAAELLLTIQLDHDPDCIVIGGGLSGLPDVVSRLETALKVIRLGETRLPVIRVAVHGGSSGARGGAILASALEENLASGGEI
jgi:N-acetylglucosamine kinase